MYCIVLSVMTTLLTTCSTQFIVDGFGNQDNFDDNTNQDNIDNFYPGKDGSGIQPKNQDYFYVEGGNGMTQIDPTFLDKFQKACYRSVNYEIVKYGKVVVLVMSKDVERYILMIEGEKNNY